MTVYLHSLGCDKNLVDSEIMLGLLYEAGYKTNSDPSLADTIVVNTCGFIQEAVEEGIQTILEMAQYKKSAGGGNCETLIVTGCMAQRYRDEILAEIPEVDKILGVNDYPMIVGKEIDVLDDELYEKRARTMPLHIAYIKISEGCDNCCTYCTIPSIRGSYRDRKFESIIKECERLAKNGAKEFVIVAQDTAKYGTQLYGRNRLHELLNELASIENMGWIRIMYAYPEHIYPKLIETIAENDKICKYIDMPIQHSHDAVIARMGRKSTNENLKKLIAQLKDKKIAIRTTIITGFPGETEAEFESLVAFIKEAKFEHLGVFTYSKEEDTPAAKMKPQIKANIKKARQNEIMEAQAKIAEEHNSALIGQILKVIVDGNIAADSPEADEIIYCGRSDRFAYDVDGTVFFSLPSSSQELISGDWVKIKINQNQGYDVYGELVEIIED